MALGGNDTYKNNLVIKYSKLKENAKKHQKKKLMQKKKT